MTHWKKLTNPNYLGAYSIENGQDIILTIDYIREETVTGTDGKKDNCVVCHFKENAKPMILNATNMKTITKLFKTPYIENWTGKQIQIGVEKIKAFGDVVDALRVRKYLPRITSQDIKCECCGGSIQAAGKMTVEETAQYTKDKYGQALCYACAMKRVQEVNNNATEQ
ncbi:MAG: hypothetical protein J1F17_06000 [Oscillospiraceae bacterium]|nr:hypothetical protein [Oscillospiraceae bacterium]